MSNFLTPIRTAVQRYVQWEAHDLGESSPTGRGTLPNTFTTDGGAQIFDASWVGRQLRLIEYAGDVFDFETAIASISGDGKTITTTEALPAAFAPGDVATNWGVASNVYPLVRKWYWFSAAGKLISNLARADMPALSMYGENTHPAPQATVASTKPTYRLKFELYVWGKAQDDIEELFCTLYDRIIRGRNDEFNSSGVGIETVQMPVINFEFFELATGQVAGGPPMGHYWKCTFDVECGLRRALQALA